MTTGCTKRMVSIFFYKIYMILFENIVKIKQYQIKQYLNIFLISLRI